MNYKIEPCLVCGNLAISLTDKQGPVTPGEWAFLAKKLRDHCDLEYGFPFWEYEDDKPCIPNKYLLHAKLIQKNPIAG